MCGCLVSGYRKLLRQKYDLPESPCNDTLLHCCCLGCALCQENRELKNRGWEPKLGERGAAGDQGKRGRGQQGRESP